MSPRTKEQYEEIRDSKRSHILDAAIECFATKGYHAVSISELANHAGISKGLMYNYYISKEELLKEIFREILSQLGMLDTFDPDRAGVIDRKGLLQYLNRLFRHLKSNLIIWKMYMAIFSQPTVQEILKDEIRASSKQPLEMLECYFKSQGSKKPKVDVAYLSTLFSGVIYEYISDPENYPLNEIKKRIINIYK
ncbi:MAG: TetR/AcrR family transcriptional regulator [Bacteroidales bacterium]|jgi:AcrR family transcriptional regulator|nr:TetR/AcrR family transcriptional regulator [Bacteroidales bacterium]